MIAVANKRVTRNGGKYIVWNVQYGLNFRSILLTGAILYDSSGRKFAADLLRRARREMRQASKC